MYWGIDVRSKKIIDIKVKMSRINKITQYYNKWFYRFLELIQKNICH